MGVESAQIIEHEGLVRRVCWRYRKAGIPLDDLHQVGRLGLCRAIQRYNPEKGAFTSIAVPWIRCMVFRELYKMLRVVRVPPYVIDRAHAIRNERDRFEQKARGSMNDDEFSEAAGLDLSEVQKIQRYTSAGTVFFDTPLPDDKDKCFGDVLPQTTFKGPDVRRHETEVVLILRRAIGTLPEREGKMVREYFGIDTAPHSLEEVGRMHGISGERVRILVNRAIDRLRRVYGRLPNSITS